MHDSLDAQDAAKLGILALDHSETGRGPVYIHLPDHASDRSYDGSCSVQKFVIHSGARGSS